MNRKEREVLYPLLGLLIAIGFVSTAVGVARLLPAVDLGAVAGAFTRLSDRRVPEPAHLECAANACVRVRGAGRDRCLFDTDCAPKTETVRSCAFKACVEVPAGTAGTIPCISDRDCASFGQEFCGDGAVQTHLGEQCDPPGSVCEGVFYGLQCAPNCRCYDEASSLTWDPVRQPPAPVYTGSCSGTAVCAGLCVAQTANGPKDGHCLFTDERGCECVAYTESWKPLPGASDAGTGKTPGGLTGEP